jgi:hypothetical protein
MITTNHYFSIIDFDFPFHEEWLLFYEQYPVFMLKSDPYISLHLTEWIYICNFLIEEQLGILSDNANYMSGIVFIYGACMCSLFNGKWIQNDGATVKVSDIGYESFGILKILLNPYNQIRKLDYNTDQSRFIKLLILDCFHAHMIGEFESLSGHPIFQYDVDRERCPLSNKAKLALYNLDIDIYGLLRIALKMEFAGFDVKLCSRKIGSNLSYYI